MSGRLLLACIALALSACATGPKKAAPPSTAHQSPGTKPAAQPAQRKVSPYAPAQEDLSKRGDYVAGGLYAPGVKDSAPDDPLHDVDLIPEPDVVDEPRSRYGNRSPYTVLGKDYKVRDSATGYVERGLASYYGNKFHGRRTSNLEVYDMYAFTAAHKTLPLPSFARVTNLDNGKSVVVRVNDRGPFHDGRIVDLSYAAAVKLGYRNTGTARVEVRGLGPGEGPINEAARERYDGIAQDTTPAAKTPDATASSALKLPPGVRIATGKPATLTPSPSTAVAAAKPAATKPNTAMDKLVGLLPVATANAGERPPQSVSATASTTSTAATPAQTSAHPAPAGTDWRFDMRQDGKAMTADEFDAWMRSRRASVATGKPGKPVRAPQADAAPVVAAAAPPPPTPAQAAAVTQAASAGTAGDVVLQVASFSNAQNASHALALLKGAEIAGARLMDANVNGQKVYRLRVGPVTAARAPELAARVAGLGFGQPQRVRD